MHNSLQLPSVLTHGMSQVNNPAECTNYEYIKEHYRDEQLEDIFNRTQFIKGGEVERVFLLNPRLAVVIILFLDEPDQTLPYCLTLTTNNPHPLEIS